jgi:putative protease
MKPIELLSPARTIKNMRYAFAFGADAVYAGLPRYSLRVRNNDFLSDNLAKGIDEAHRHDKKFFLATNVIPHNAKVKTFMADIAPIIVMKPDALIMDDQPMQEASGGGYEVKIPLPKIRSVNGLLARYTG